MFQPSHSKQWVVASSSSQISTREKQFFSLLSLTRRDNERRGVFCDCLNGSLSLSCLVII